MPRAAPLAAALFVGFRALEVASGALCPSKLLDLSDPNCGAEDPECPLSEPFRQVNVSSDNEFCYVRSSFCPPYDWSCIRSPKGRRPCARTTTFKIPLRPRPAAGPKVPVGLKTEGGFMETLERRDSARHHVWWEVFEQLPGVPLQEDASPMLGAVGVLANGVALNAVATKLSEALPAEAPKPEEDRWVNAGLAEAWMEDSCHGHVSNGGNYHVHAGRWAPPARAPCGLPVDQEGQHSQLLGWAFDGYGLYGPLDVGGRPPADLDGCGGHSQEGQGGYHYHLVERNSFNIACFHGCPEPSNNFRFKGVACEPGEEADARPPRPPPSAEL